MIDEIISTLESMQEDMEEHGEMQKARGVSSAIWLIEIMQEWADRKTEPTGYNLSPVDKDINVRTNSSEKPNNCECEPRKEQNFCGKCRYLYRDFKYGLSCYRLMDNEPCKYEERKENE